MSTSTPTEVFSLSSSQVASAIAHNKSLNLSPSAIRIIQHVVCVDLTGEFDENTIRGLNQRDYNEVFIKNFIFRTLQAKGQNAPTTWDAVVSLVTTASNSGLLTQLTNELGKLNDEVIWLIASSLKDQGGHTLAIHLTGDFIGQKVNEKTLAFRYKADLDQPYLTQVAGEKIVVSSQHDSQRTNGVFRVTQTVPHTEIIAFYGPKAFENFASLKSAITNSLAIQFASVVPPKLSASRSVSTKAIDKSKVYYSHPIFVKAVQLSTGAPVTGKMDDTTVKFIADFQAKNGLGVDGIIGKGQTLPKMITHLEKLGLQETAVLLIMGYYNMWITEETMIFFYASEQNVKVIVNRSIDGLDMIAIGKTAFSGAVTSKTIDEFVQIIYPMATPIAEYDRGTRFVGKKIIAHRAFFPHLDRANAYAEKHDLWMSINSSFRAEGANISGAIVRQAKTSNHEAGFAIDFNFWTTSSPSSSVISKRLKKAESTWPPSIRNYVKDIRGDERLRWGGDFNDPVHIDIRVNKTMDVYDPLYYGSQNAWNLYMKNGTRAIDFSIDDVACDH